MIFFIKRAFKWHIKYHSLLEMFLTAESLEIYLSSTNHKFIKAELLYLT